jgi:hypothetical protein
MSIIRCLVINAGGQSLMIVVVKLVGDANLHVD